MSQCDTILALLADRPRTTREILREIPCIVHSRIADLRKRGHNIICERRPGRTGADAYAYRLLDPPSASAADSPAVEVGAAPFSPSVPERGRRPNPGDRGEACAECSHPDYDHVGWDCLRIGCACSGFAPMEKR